MATNDVTLHLPLAVEQPDLRKRWVQTEQSSCQIPRKACLHPEWSEVPNQEADGVILGITNNCTSTFLHHLHSKLLVMMSKVNLSIQHQLTLGTKRDSSSFLWSGGF